MKTKTILINGAQRPWRKRFITYREIAELSGYNSNSFPTVTYHTYKSKGSLNFTSKRVYVYDRMIFDCIDTSNA